MRYSPVSTRQTRLLRQALLAGASMLLAANPAVAQDAPPPAAAADQQPAAGDIVVTASRITRDGYTAPTPTTVIGQDFIKQRAVTDIGDALNRVPAFRAAVSPSAGGLGNTGAFLADLRGLGPTRTLVLLDRGRLPQTMVPGVTTSAGTTDLNVIPTVLLRNSDVVTGGASAAYGSDAVSGVVNFQIDDKFSGVRGSFQYGETRYHDAKNKFATIAAGTSFANGMGHVVVGFEYNDNGGTAAYNTARAWGRNAWNNATIASRPAGTPNTIVGPYGNYFGTATSGGLILTNGPLKGLAFVPTASGGVTTATFTPGLGNMTASLDFFTPAALAANAAAGINNLNTQQLRPAQTRYNFMGKVTLDLSDRLSLYFEPLYSNVTNTGIILVRRDGAGAGPSLTIAKDNAFLAQALTPAQLALVPAGGLSIGYSGQDWGPSVRSIRNELIRLQTGVKGSFGKSWKWDASYVFGENTSRVKISNTFNSANFRNAIDAVSVGGQIVCRSAAAVAAGCVPLNILGKANPSAAAAAYVLGTASGSGVTQLHDLSANLQGEPFSTWAGPVSVGVGVDYRRESIRLDTDPLSQTSGWLSGTGVSLPTVKQTVKEAYFETIVPLAKDLPLAKSFEFNGAVRATDYSTSGSVTTWKAGLTWEPFDGLLIRSTRSRDIRAPNLIELFTPQTQSLPLPADPRVGVARPTNNAGFIVGGNPNLKPERATTQTVGVSYQPSFFQRLRLSADYYNIRIQGAITSTGTQGVVNNCFIGGVYTGNSWCSLITFANNDPVAGQMTGVQGVTANVAEFKTRGIDFALNYRQPMEDIGLAGMLTVNVMTTRVISFWSSTDVSTLFPAGIDRAGQTGAAFGGPAGLPKWLTNATLDYEIGGFGINTNVRYISRSRQNNGLFGPDQAGYNPALTTSINDNNIRAAAYVDLGLRYSFGPDRQFQVYFNIDNLLDRDPPLPANGSAYYDLMGRTFKGGVRFKF
ncbi:TonB-dependent receptor domain-containing protein [Novosphingobium aerophilum]|uniref:TonB-dependent receptor n=1 Tax=Novosphingobium aerophilum TaxID=2839843 RepID=A0A7X1FAV1_9SPHN|nr:TonB-dependent receptor [Novosphingobium aerophilum]MBC2653582.1 TonB-dependent receptor [Novosphingobium aerophilum]